MLWRKWGDLQDHRSPKSSITPLSALPGNGNKRNKRFTLGVNCFASTFAVGSLLKRALTLRTITELT